MKLLDCGLNNFEEKGKVGQGYPVWLNFLIIIIFNLLYEIVTMTPADEQVKRDTIKRVLGQYFDVKFCVLCWI